MDQQSPRGLAWLYAAIVIIIGFIITIGSISLWQLDGLDVNLASAIERGEPE
ncbi:hypothetical protein [Rhizobium sp. R339]|uniref:hypothetical protein n=1 Tax=Rhizobium sp. R339 TaxID=1764273 RepID=UPI00167C4A7A|nr:hypothetical protein [Rhizobium sp. R339]